MTRTADVDSRPFRGLGSAAIAILLLVAASVGCSKKAAPTSAKVRLAISLGANAVDSLTYRVLRSDRPDPLVSGSISASNLNAAGGVDVVLPAGPGNLAEVIGVSSDSQKYVGSSQPFDVVAGQDMAVAIQVMDQASLCEACEKAPHMDGVARHTCAVAAIGTPGTLERFGCNKFTGQLREECKTLRACITGKHCAKGNNVVPCYCGELDSTTCVAKGAPKTAPCYREYEAALVGGPPGKVEDLFVDPASPIGIANNLFRCDVDAQCPCGQ